LTGVEFRGEVQPERRRRRKARRASVEEHSPIAESSAGGAQPPAPESLPLPELGDGAESGVERLARRIEAARAAERARLAGRRTPG
jgi:hypothetical protein